MDTGDLTMRQLATRKIPASETVIDRANRLIGTRLYDDQTFHVESAAQDLDDDPAETLQGIYDALLGNCSDAEIVRVVHGSYEKLLDRVEFE